VLLALILIAVWLRPGSVPRTLPLPPPTVATETAFSSVAERPPPAEADPAAIPEIPEPSAPSRSNTPGSSLRALMWLARNQNEDGSWGDGPATVGPHAIGRTGITALALLSLLGGGYSQLSKDQYDDLDFGVVFRRGVLWLLKDQKEDGTFRSVLDAGLDHAMATLAIHETYGTTASQPLKDPAQKALDALLLQQRPDGSWAADGPTAWGLWAMLSAETNQQPIPPEAKAKALQHALRSSDPGIADMRMIWTRTRTAEDQLLLLNLGAPQSLDFDRLLFGTQAAFRFDAPDGPVWTQWNAGMIPAVLQTQGADGSWPGVSKSQTIVRSSLALQTLQVYYVYR
jgi:hypothetical protein